MYVGETHRTPKQRWMSHDCRSYIGNYIELHRRYSLDVAVGIVFWYGAPANRKQRLQLESEFIYKWRSPFNKELAVVGTTVRFVKMLGFPSKKFQMLLSTKWTYLIEFL